MAMLVLKMLGTPLIENNGEPLQVDRHKASALLIYLVMTGRTYHRDTLATFLWPESDQVTARASVRRILVSLRKAVPKNFLNINGKHIGLSANAEYWADVHEFRRQLSCCRTHRHPENEVCDACSPLLKAALDLYRGDFLEGFSLRDSPSFDDWQFFEAENLRREYSGALERLIHYHSNLQEYEQAITYARRWLAIDPLHEPAHVQLMQLYQLAGQRAAALRQYQECARLLKDNLNVSPQVETTQLYENIRKDKNRFMSFEETNGRIKPAYNLPQPPMKLIGRTSEFSDIENRLADPSCQLLTIVGPGGIGKTHLAIHAGLNQARNFPHGVFFIPLAAVRSSEAMLIALMDHLGVIRNTNETPEAQLLKELYGRQLLLILDNFEHLLQSYELLAKFLAYIPRVKVIVTSRERLRLHGEWVLELKGLAYPKTVSAEKAESYGSVQLFVEAAQQHSLGFQLDDQVKPHIVRICQLVEGMPLALELAAAWVRVLSCEEIAKELEQRLDLLVTNLHNVPERHRSIHATLEYSWNLLNHEEKSALIGLSVFRGGFSREAAEQVAGLGLVELGSFVDRSLLQRKDHGRYELHELIRRFAFEKGVEADSDLCKSQSKHSNYFGDFLDQRIADLEEDGNPQIQSQVEKELENIRLAWDWAVSHNNAEVISRAAQGLHLLFERKGLFQESREAFQKARLSLIRAKGPQLAHDEILGRLLGKLLTLEGKSCTELGFCQEAKGLLEEALSILSQQDSSIELAEALRQMGLLDMMMGNYNEAQGHIEHGLAVSKKLDWLIGVAYCLNFLGYMAGELGKLDEAKRLLSESLSLSRKIGKTHLLRSSLNSLGYVLYLRGDYRRAKDYLLGCIRVSNRPIQPHSLMMVYLNLGLVTAALEEFEESESYFNEVLDAATAMNAIPTLLYGLVGKAILFSRSGELEQAVELLLFVIAHPMCIQETKDLAVHKFEEIASHLPNSMIAQLQMKAEELALNDIMLRYLAPAPRGLQ
jgi:predicted ATPase/DNA-binding SARP family transcriptional activator/Tfp pilus assembly protein PilF